MISLESEKSQMSKEELLKSLTPEQLEKVKACKNADEILELAHEEGVDISEEQLHMITGGNCSTIPECCPECSCIYFETVDENVYRCKFCSHQWHEHNF